MSTTIHVSGLNTKPVSLIPLASDSRFRVYPQSSLPACWLRFSWMGLESVSTLTHWVTMTNFFLRGRIPKVSDLSRHENAMVILVILFFYQLAHDEINKSKRFIYCKQSIFMINIFCLVSMNDAVSLTNYFRNLT